ncbi:hypothetical protein [Lysobacter brunescens]|uniref:Uncharacterized protein n=1 Tax=Lysobacter brunescens TaxID=262323 RepID=A0ABW2YGG5_9GAMM
MNSTDQASHLDGFKATTGAAGGDCSTGDNTVQSEDKAAAYLRARLTVMMASRNRLQAELEEHRARAAMHRACPAGSDESARLALCADYDGDRIRDTIESVSGRINDFMQRHPELEGETHYLRLMVCRTGNRHKYIAQVQQVTEAMAKHSPDAAARALVLVAERHTTPRGVRTLCGDLQATVRHAHADVLADEAPHARVTFEIGHNTITASVALNMGSTVSASRTWCRSGNVSWNSTERDFAQRSPNLGAELAEFVDGIDLPMRVADMLPVRRHGTDTAAQAAAAKALAQG